MEGAVPFFLHEAVWLEGMEVWMDGGGVDGGAAVF